MQVPLFCTGFQVARKTFDKQLKCHAGLVLTCRCLHLRKGEGILGQLPRNRVLTETDGPFTQNQYRPSVPQDVAQITGAC